MGSTYMTMAAVAVSRGLSRFCIASKHGFGPLRINGLYRFPTQVSVSAVNTLSSKCKTLVLHQPAKTFSVSSVSSAAPEIEQAGHDHVMHWNAERILSVFLLGAIPAAVVFPSSALEYIVALSLTVHSHWGVEALVVDYVRPAWFGNIIPKISLVSVYLISAMTLGGLCYFIYTDVGIVNAVKMLWKL